MILQLVLTSVNVVLVFFLGNEKLSVSRGVLFKHSLVAMCVARVSTSHNTLHCWPKPPPGGEFFTSGRLWCWLPVRASVCFLIADKVWAHSTKLLILRYQLSHGGEVIFISSWGNFFDFWSTPAFYLNIATWALISQKFWSLPHEKW